MQHSAVRHAGCGLLLALTLGTAGAQDAPAAIKRKFELPPSADLHYELQARQRGFGLKGEAIVTWRAGDGKYAVSAESKVPLLGTITHDRSSGVSRRPRTSSSSTSHCPAGIPCARRKPSRCSPQ